MVENYLQGRKKVTPGGLGLGERRYYGCGWNAMDGCLGDWGQTRSPGTRRQHPVDSPLATALEGTALGDARRPLGVCWRLGGVQGCSRGASTNGAVDA